MSIHSKNIPVGKALAGLGAALVLAAPSLAFAKFCPVDIDVTSSGTLGALQLGVDYSAASALGDLVGCAIEPAGLTDTDIDATANLAVLGYADATGFSTPSSFARCYFEVTNDADPAPTSGQISVGVDDASNTDIPPDPVSATVSVTVGDCIPSIGSCSWSPATGCKLPVTTGKSKLSFKDGVDTAKDQGQFQWKAGAATLLSEFGTPLDAGETYSWCVYDGGDLVLGTDVPAVTGWTASGTTGFQFKGDVAGVAQIKLKAGEAGKASVAVKAKSKAGNFSSPGLPLGSSVVSQLIVDNGVTTTCFQSTFTAPSKNDAASYSSKD